MAGILGKRKFDDVEVRNRFLEGLRLHGYPALAAAKAGVCMNTVNKWIKEMGEAGQQFEAEWKLAMLLHGQEVCEQIEHEALHGHEQPIFDKSGKKVGVKKIIETPLRAMLLKKHNPDFREKSEITHKAETGVLAVPMPVQTVGAWAELVKSAKAAADDRAAEEKKGRES